MRRLIISCDLVVDFDSDKALFFMGLFDKVVSDYFVCNLL